MAGTVFDEIVRGEHRSWKVWEDDAHLAFLTPFPNTPGTTVVIPKKNTGDNVFLLDDEEYAALLLATKKVGNLLMEAFHVARVGMVFEGTGVAHVHAKLYPLYGELASQTEVSFPETEFVMKYRGYLTTLEGPRQSEEELDRIQKTILSVNNPSS